MILPRIDAPVTPGQISLGGYEVLNANSIANQVKRALRQSYGVSAYELTISGSDEKAALLSNYAGLNKDEAADEAKLSLALDDLLKTIIEAIDESVSSYPDEDHRILKAVAARHLKFGLADSFRTTVAHADNQLAELRKINAA